MNPLAFMNVLPEQSLVVGVVADDALAVEVSVAEPATVASVKVLPP